MSVSVADKPFSVGPWRIEPDLNRIRNGESSIQLEPKVMQVLQVMARNAGNLTARHALLEEVWGNAFIGEDPTTRAISELRKIFGDDPRSPRFIETIHGKGYRLIATVEVGRDAPTHESQPALGVSSRRRLLVAAVILSGISLVWLGRLSSRDPRATAMPSSRPIPLTTYPGREIHPAVSPDGGRIAFAWAGAGGQGLDIYVKQRNTEQPLRLTDSQAVEIMPSWSPDGTEVAFLRTTADGCTVLAVPAIGGPERPLYTCGAHFSGYDWSPRGDRLVVADLHAGDEARSLYLIDLDEGTRTRLTRPWGSRAEDTAPQFSPDGRQVAFRRKLGEARFEMFLLDLASGEPRQITHDAEDNAGFAWTPSGEEWVVASNRGGRFELWLIDVGSGEATPLGLEDAYLPSISSSSGTLVYEKRNDNLDIWRAPNPHRTDDGEVDRWTESTWDDLDPQYSRDGSRVAFVSTRSGSFELWVAHADGSMPRQLTHFEKPMPGWSPAVQHPRWSPDGERLVFSARAEDDFDIFTIAASGGVPRPITASVGDDLNPAWIAGGEWVYFATNRGGSWELWRSRIEGRPEKVEIGAQVRSLDSHGGDVLFLTTFSGALHRYEHTSGALHQINDYISDFSWGLAPGAVYWATSGELIRLDTEQGRATVKPLPGGQTPAGGHHIAASSLSISPDEKWILFSGVYRNESDLMLVEGLF